MSLRLECGAFAVTVAWTVKDSKGELLSRFIAGSPREVVAKSCGAATTRSGLKSPPPSRSSLIATSRMS